MPMAVLQQQIRFCRSADGTRIAYATCGSGPPLVWVGHFARHLELDWDNPIWRAWLTFLSRQNTLIRYDLRGCGLSDRDVKDISLATLAQDFDAVVDGAGLKRFAFFGTAGNVAAGIAHAVQHPDRISHLILYGCHTRGRLNRPRTPEDDHEAETRLSAMEFGWSSRNTAFQQFFTALHAPDTLPPQFHALNDLLRFTTAPETATRLIRAYWGLDLRAQLQSLRCSTLVLHARHDPIVPFEEGRLAASLVPDARFVPLESKNHIIHAEDPAWQTMQAAVRDFLLAISARPPGLEEL
jgi:pimeloyl-ACP methyl ester carboxylesterase